MKKRKYWAGFTNNKMDTMAEYYGEYSRPAIFIKKKDAQIIYQDVRPVEVRELKE